MRCEVVQHECVGLDRGNTCYWVSFAMVQPCANRQLSHEELAVTGQGCLLPDLIVESIVRKQRQ